MTKKVFISHAQNDKKFADRICEKLETNGYSCWIAPRDIPYGTDWAGEITGSIKECRLFVFLLSKSSVESRQCPKEITLADNAGKPMICIQMDETKMNPMMEYHFLSGQLCYFNPEKPDETLDELLISAKRILGEPEKPEPAEKTPERKKTDEPTVPQTIPTVPPQAPPTYPRQDPTPAPQPGPKIPQPSPAPQPGTKIPQPNPAPPQQWTAAPPGRNPVQTASQNQFPPQNKKKPVYKKVWFWIVIILGVNISCIIFLLILGVLSSGVPQSGIDPDQKAEVKYEITDTYNRCYQNEYSNVRQTVIVQIKNTGTCNIDFGTCEYDVNDPDSHFITKSYFSVFPPVVAPGEICYLFNSKYLPEGCSADVEYQIEPKIDARETTAHTEYLEVYDLDSRVELGYPTVTGRVRNGTGTGCSSVSASFVCSTPDGRIILIDHAYIGNLEAGASDSFENYMYELPDDVDFNTLDVKVYAVSKIQ